MGCLGPGCSAPPACRAVYDTCHQLALVLAVVPHGMQMQPVTVLCPKEAFDEEYLVRGNEDFLLGRVVRKALHSCSQASCHREQGFIPKLLSFVPEVGGGSETAKSHPATYYGLDIQVFHTPVHPVALTFPHALLAALPLLHYLDSSRQVKVKIFETEVVSVVLWRASCRRSGPVQPRVQGRVHGVSHEDYGMALMHLPQETYRAF